MIIFPGSFNPIHKGHIGIINKVKDLYGRYPLLEISQINVDKGEIDKSIIVNNIKHIIELGYDVITTKNPRFIDKIRFFGGKDNIYIVGIDTWNRMFDSKYCDIDELYNTLNRYEVYFDVFGRNDTEFNNYGYRFVKYYEYNVNISSTEIRNLNQIAKVKNSIIVDVIITRNDGYEDIYGDKLLHKADKFKILNISKSYVMIDLGLTDDGEYQMYSYLRLDEVEFLNS